MNLLKVPLSLWVWLGLCLIYRLSVFVLYDKSNSTPPVLVQSTEMILLLYLYPVISEIFIFPWNSKKHIHSEKCKHNKEH